MWHGYKQRDPSFQEFVTENNLRMYDIHTSGHATKSDLMKLAESMNPKHLIPIHTIHGDDFQSDFKNVLRITHNDYVGLA